MGFLFFDIGVEFFVPVFVAGVFHGVGGFVEGAEETFGGVEKQERLDLFVHRDKVDDGGLVVSLIDVQFVLLDGLLFLFERLDAEQELVCLFAGVAGGSDRE